MQSFNQFLEANFPTLGSLYNDLASMFPGQENRIKGILKDQSPTMIKNYNAYSRPNPEYDRERATMGIPPVKRMGPELAILSPEQYNQMKEKVISIMKST